MPCCLDGKAENGKANVLCEGKKGAEKMKFKCPMLVVNDIKKSREFYKKVLGLRVISDFGANITFTGGLALQTKESWIEFIGKQSKDIKYKGNDTEMYFEEDDFDNFIKKLKSFSEIEYVHDVIEHFWGQRAVRFYDPDFHIIEVGENMKLVCKRFLEQGMSIEEVAKKTLFSEKFVQSCL